MSIFKLLLNFNHGDRFPGDEKPYIPEGLQLLNLERNCISDWFDIVRLEPQLKK